MSREVHALFCERLGGKFPGSTHLIIHCTTKEQSAQIEQALAKRLEECSLKLHPEKTKIVYCRDGTRNGKHPTKKFTFLGYTFQPRSAQNRWTKKRFLRFLPAVSTMAAKKFRDNIKSRNIFRMHHLNVDELAKQVNPLIRGWYGYFSHCYKSALYRMNDWLDMAIVRWLRAKFRLQWRDAYSMLRRLVQQNPRRFAHWLFRLPGRAV